jgi:GNAT superfamily N-acetyltransferase
MEIRLSKQSDAAKFVEHLERLINSSGTIGIIFSPRESGEFKPTENDRRIFEQRWVRAIGEPGWERCFLCEVDDEILGHILLRAKNVKSSLHRVDLQMGLEPSSRNKGIGKKLLGLAIDWARTNTSVEWIDLGVFESNSIAVRLYEKHGFSVTGKVTDCFRVYGQSMNDLTMTLKLR